MYSNHDSEIHLPIITTRIKTRGEAPLAMQRAMSMSIVLKGTISTRILSVAVAFNSIAMVLIPARFSMKVFSKTASALSQTRKRCESYGIMSWMQILVKLAKQKILSTGTRPNLYSLNIQLETYNR